MSSSSGITLTEACRRAVTQPVCQQPQPVIADVSGHAILNIWENHIGKIKEGSSYKLKGLMVKEYCGNKSLSTSKENFSIEEIDDIGSLSDSYTDGKMVLDIQLIQDVRVFAVEKLDSYCSCIKCKTCWYCGRSCTLFKAVTPFSLVISKHFCHFKISVPVFTRISKPSLCLDFFISHPSSKTGLLFS